MCNLGRYLSDLVQGDLGRSIKSHERVSVELMARFPATMELTFASMVFACILGIGAGVASAVRRGTWWDYIGMTASLAGVSVPIFWLGLLLILALAVSLPLFPVSGRLSSHVFIPTLTGFYLIDSLIAGDLPSFWRRTLAFNLAGHNPGHRARRCYRAHDPVELAGSPARRLCTHRLGKRLI